MPSEAAVVPAGGLVVRFGGTERLLHLIHAVGFLAMLGTGLLLYVPGLTDVLGGRPVAKGAHLASAIGWLVLLAVVVLVGNRRSLRVTLAEIEAFDQDDRDWLRRRPAPQGRFNAGQKLHTVVQAGFAVLFLVSGVLLWAGERVNDLRLPGTVVVHDVSMFLTVGLLLGHLWLALVWPPTRHALRGIVLGTVRADWAARHHAKWMASTPVPPAVQEPRPRALAAASALVLVGVLAASWSVRDATGDSAGENVSIAAPASAPSPEPAQAAAAAAPPSESPTAPPPPDPAADPLQLALEGQQLQQAGSLNAAIVRYRLAVKGLPGRADVRAALGLALVDAGNVPEGLAQLRRATRTRPAYPEARLLLGRALLESGSRAEGIAQLRRYLRAPGDETAAQAARALLRDARRRP